MSTFFVVFGAFAFVILIMSVGVIFKRKPFSGSCGGLNNVYQKEDGSCQICGAQVNDDCKNKVENY